MHKDSEVITTCCRLAAKMQPARRFKYVKKETREILRPFNHPVLTPQVTWTVASWQTEQLAVFSWCLVTAEKWTGFNFVVLFPKLFLWPQKTLPLPLPSQSAECLTTSVPAVITSDSVWWNDKKGHLKRMENKGCCSNYFLLNNSFSRDKLLVIKWGIERHARSSVVIIKLLI